MTILRLAAMLTAAVEAMDDMQAVVVTLSELEDANAMRGLAIGMVVKARKALVALAQETP